MEGLEIHPVITRIVCLNQPHLKPLWITQGLSTTLGCFYNPHQSQIIWTEVPLQLPAPRILRIKGHTSHALPSMNTPVLKANVQMGTYLVFHIPKTNRSWSSCHLVLNGVQSVLRGMENPTQFSLHLINNDQQYQRIQKEKDDASSHERNRCSLNNDSNTKVVKRVLTNGSSIQNSEEGRADSARKGSFVACRRKVFEAESIGGYVRDFGGIEEVTTIVEEDAAVPSDQDSDDASEDIHKVVFRRLVTDINIFIKEWEKSKNEENILILLLKPEQKYQAWQFLSSWISVKERITEETVPFPTLTRRKGVTRAKPFPPSLNTTITSTSSTTATITKR